jgi:hypothetical protein
MGDGLISNSLKKEGKGCPPNPAQQTTRSIVTPHHPPRICTLSGMGRESDLTINVMISIFVPEIRWRRGAHGAVARSV